jgi:hypothetical protein
MDTSGKIFHDPTPEEIKKFKLMPVDHPTKEQLARGQVLSTEKCPCGSGRLVKNCCLKKNKHGVVRGLLKRG